MSTQTTRRGVSAERGVRAPRPLRADIQALRALAVLLVVVYHFWPKRLTGGYVGVDVFFVISGFLITSHLISSPPRNLAELGRFWGRRVRRLLPASFLVLLVTLGVSLIWAPATMWSNIAKQVAASALYVQNWFLAAEAVDYLAEDNAATPVQHFWSLSVEEQFYIVWPVLIAVALLVAARFGWKNERRVMTGAVGLVVVLSLAASVLLTTADPAGAYFVSWTRFWELGIGGVVAGLAPLLQRWLAGVPVVRLGLLIVGLLTIVFSAWTYTPSTPFPSYTALLPVLGTAAVIVAAVDEQRWALTRPIGWKPVQLLGDISYSLYLWHWPAVVLLPLALGRTLRWPEKLLCIAVLVMLSFATKVFVEDRFRGSTSMGKGVKGTFAFMLVGMLVVTGCSLGVVGAVAQTERNATAQVQNAIDSDACVGSRALVDDGCEPHGEKLITDPAFAAADKPDPYQDGCWILGDFSEQRTCHYGSDGPDALKVALIGNSHAGHWLPTLQEIDETTPWSITTYLISECYTVDAVIQFETKAKTDNCYRWNQRVVSEIAERGYDLVVLSNRTNRPLRGLTRDETFPAAQKEHAKLLDRWSAAGIPVLILRDTPYATDLSSVPDCVAANLHDLSECDGTRARKQKDPLADAALARKRPLVEVVDLTDRICRDDICYATVGGVIVYFDRGHLSATFARTLAGDVRARAEDLLSRAGDAR